MSGKSTTPEFESEIISLWVLTTYLNVVYAYGISFYVIGANKLLKNRKQIQLRLRLSLSSLPDFIHCKETGLESVSIRRIQCLGYDVLEFLGVGTTFDIFQNILFPYSLYTAYCLSWIRRIGLVSFVVFGECKNRYTVSSLMDMAY
ncbi:hypothetical protein Tco_0520910 [Tanacetum coccineum]